MQIEKIKIVVGILVGIILGILSSVLFLAALINSIPLENLTVSIELNETKIIDAINERQNIPTKTVINSKQLEREYDKGFLDGLNFHPNNILFAGSTFKYGEYVIKAQDILPDRVEIQVLQNGDYVFNGTCYENAWCNIKDISFQIDDIHIGKEASYIVYWSDK